MLHEMNNDILLGAVRRNFPGSHVTIMRDPEDDCVAYIRVYGIPDASVKQRKAELRSLIRSLDGVIDVTPFIPSIVSLSDTKAFYPNFLPDPPADDVAVSVSVLSAMERLRDGQSRGILQKIPAQDWEWPSWDPRRPSIVSDIDSMEEVSDARTIRFAA